MTRTVFHDIASRLSAALFGPGAAPAGQTRSAAELGVAFILVTQRWLGEHEAAELAFEATRGEGARKMLLMIVVMTVHSFGVEPPAAKPPQVWIAMPMPCFTVPFLPLPGGCHLACQSASFVAMSSCWL